MESLLCLLNSQPESSALLTLDQVQASFQHWRNTRTHRTAPVPLGLWNHVLSLIGRYPESEILKKLKIHKVRLKAVLAQTLQNTSQSLDFVPLSTPQVPLNVESNNTNALNAEILHTNGTKLRVHSLSDQQFSNLLVIFMKGS